MMCKLKYLYSRIKAMSKGLVPFIDCLYQNYRSLEMACSGLFIFIHNYAFITVLLITVLLITVLLITLLLINA